MTAEQAAAVLYRTLECAKGGLFRVYHDPNESIVSPALRVGQILYRFRKEIGDPELMRIQIYLSRHDPDHELWLIVKTGESP